MQTSRGSHACTQYSYATTATWIRSRLRLARRSPPRLLLTLPVVPSFAVRVRVRCGAVRCGAVRCGACACVRVRACACVSYHPQLPLATLRKIFLRTSPLAEDEVATDRQRQLDFNEWLETLCRLCHAQAQHVASQSVDSGLATLCEKTFNPFITAITDRTNVFHHAAAAAASSDERQAQ